MGSEGHSIIFLVDINSFYASVEVSLNPELKGKPVVVGQDPRKGKTRGVALTATYEAKAYGIKSGMPVNTVIKKCPDVVFSSSGYLEYSKASKRVMALLEEFAPKNRFSQASIDEAYLDMTESCSNYDDAFELAKQIQTTLEEKEGLPCSIGIGPNRTVAKIASNKQKPRGITVVPPENVIDFLKPLPVRAIPGIGKKGEMRLASIGIKTIGEIQSSTREELLQAWGKHGLTWLWNAARGIHEPGLYKGRHNHTTGSERTFAEDVSITDPLVFETLDKVSNGIHERLQGQSFRTIVLKIRFSDFETKTRSMSLKTHATSKNTILKAGLKLLKEFSEETRKIRLIGLRVAKIGAPIKKKPLENFL